MPNVRSETSRQWRNAINGWTRRRRLRYALKQHALRRQAISGVAFSLCFRETLASSHAAFGGRYCSADTISRQLYEPVYIPIIERDFSFSIISCLLVGLMPTPTVHGDRSISVLNTLASQEHYIQEVVRHSLPNHFITTNSMVYRDRSTVVTSGSRHLKSITHEEY